MNNIVIVILAYIIDNRFGEFKFIKHPVIIIGEMISFFEEKFYKNSVLRGLWLVIVMLVIVSMISFALEEYLKNFGVIAEIIISSFISSMFIAHKMLKDSVKEIVFAEDKKEKISQLVSRDVENMDESDIYKAAIETYGENLSDGVIAPIFYLLLFGLPGIVIYKTINTMDSMVGYRNKRYEKFGKVAAKLDDIANFIPSRLTAMLIMICAKQKNIFAFYEDGKKHESPNAGHPITAIALACGIRLGGDTSYFGKMKKKPFFGNGREKIQKDDILKALKICT